METFTKEILGITFVMEQESISTFRLENSIMDNGEKTHDQDLEHFCSHTDRSIKEIGKMIKRMAKESLLIQMAAILMETL